ncbi:MAG: hypothetical protein JKX78_07710 [Alteromonadaceae bacterium]|nr:hypothetical protein [Alteromonadaceae bacterium]
MSDDEMKINNQKAQITSIDHLNKSFEVKKFEFQLDFTLTLNSENDADVLPMPSGKLGNYLEVGDLIEFKMKQQSYEMFNLSCEFLRLSKFKRDLISVLRRLDNDNHPLKRCVLLNEKGFVLLSAKKNADKVRLITETTRN